ncbi:DUF397 domain-containing protein [Streptomyces gamaensis]|uniref:DUF397 domain-containing protein n=1 Tax=Streptomyces gamaensis TaxID=1763542 RepID=A0ABW0YWY4_9ACTN
MTSGKPSTVAPYADRAWGWRTSRYSGGQGNCLEHGRLCGGQQAIRDTKDPERRTTLRFASDAWETFIRAVTRNEVR